MIIRTQMKLWPLAHIIHHQGGGSQWKHHILHLLSACLLIAVDVLRLGDLKSFSSHGLKNRILHRMGAGMLHRMRMRMHASSFLEDLEPLKEIGGKMFISKLIDSHHQTRFDFQVSQSLGVFYVVRQKS